MLNEQQCNKIWVQRDKQCWTDMVFALQRNLQNELTV